MKRINAKTKKAESELAEFKTQSAEWLNKLTLLNREMDRKSIRLSLMTESPFPGDILTAFAFPLAEEFTRYRRLAFDAMQAGRVEKGKDLADELDIEDHVAALSARIAPLKQDFEDVMTACIKTCRVLYPDRADADSTDELVGMLEGRKERLQL